jgi:Trypsin-like peptidase domain
VVSLRTDVWNQMLALSILRDDELEPVGTAFLIGPSLAFTATHTIDDVSEDYAVIAQQIVDHGKTPLLWSVTAMYRSPAAVSEDDRPLDIAVLALEAFGEAIETERHRRFFFELNVATPRIGQKVVAYGFTKSATRRAADDPFLFETTHRFRHVEGVVSEVRWPHRDLGMMPWPCFAVEADFDPGMSGGPIFNSQSQVCGVVSSGGILGLSWGSILWPALRISLDGIHLLDLARRGVIRVRNHHCVTLWPDNHQGPFPGVAFDPRTEIA